MAGLICLICMHDVAFKILSIIDKGGQQQGCRGDMSLNQSAVQCSAVICKETLHYSTVQYSTLQHPDEKVDIAIGETGR